MRAIADAQPLLVVAAAAAMVVVPGALARLAQLLLSSRAFSACLCSTLVLAANQSFSTLMRVAIRALPPPLPPPPPPPPTTTTTTTAGAATDDDAIIAVTAVAA